MTVNLSSAYDVRENRVRRAVARFALRLERSRRRDQRAPDYGFYRIVDPRGRGQDRVVAGNTRYSHSMTLDDVERWISSESEKVRAFMRGAG